MQFARIIGSVLAATLSAGCLCGHSQRADALVRASMIFIGEVLAVEHHLGPGHEAGDGAATLVEVPSQIVRFRVVAMLRGSVSSEITVIFRETRFPSCGTDPPDFDMGEKYLISLRDGSFDSASIHSSLLLPSGTDCDLREQL